MTGPVHGAIASCSPSGRPPYYSTLLGHAPWPLSSCPLTPSLYFFCSRSSTYPYPETPLYTQTAGTSYYEAAGTAAQVSTPATSQAVASSGSVPMYVSGSQVVASSTSSGSAASNSGSGGSGGGGGGGGGSGGGSSSGSGAGTYVIQGGYMLGSASQSYSHTTRASPATVSANPGPRGGGGGGDLGGGGGWWLPAPISRRLVPGCSAEDGLALNPCWVASDMELSLSGPQLVCMKLLELLPKKCHLL